ncbi:MAG: hypothetical protein NWF08_09520, partial [Candidatus Bathyarchaeota archaeon]|nr:hypothetical protein [Candidatus Bathyarchaeota archaeon]
MKSWKIGAVSGLIAGIVAGIAGFVHGLSVISIPVLNLNFWGGHYGFDTLTTEVIRRIAYVEITLGIIIWVVAGLIYIKIYDLIPGKGVLKGLVYSLVFYLIFS